MLDQPYAQKTTPRILECTRRVVIGLWLALLLPWVLFATVGAGMAFEGGRTIQAYLLFWSIETYPIWTFISVRYRRYWIAVAAPLITIIGLALSEYLP